MKQIIDIETWERRDNYNFFRNFVNSWYSITTEIDCTEASAAARAANALFPLLSLCCGAFGKMKSMNSYP